MNPIETDPHLLDALASLSRMSAAINRMDPGEVGDAQTALRLIVASAIQAVGDSARSHHDRRLPLTGNRDESAPSARSHRGRRLPLTGNRDESAPYAAIAVYDPDMRALDVASLVQAGEPAAGEAWLDGIGRRAMEQGERMLEPARGAGVSVCTPLVWAGQPLGALYIRRAGEHSLTPVERVMLDLLANQATLALSQTRRLASVQRDLARLEAESNRLRHASLLISSRLGLQETLDAILQMALGVTDAQYGIFRLVDRRRSKLITRAVANQHLVKPRVEELPIDTHSVMGWVAVNRQPVLIPDLRVEPWSHVYYPLDADLAMRSELAVPLIGAGGRLEGVLNLESPLENAFSEQDSHLLQAFATQAVIAIQEARLLDVLQEVAQLLLAQPYRTVLRHLADLACDLLNGDVSAIWTVEGEQLVLQVASAGSEHAERLALDGSFTGLAVLSKKPVTAEDVRTDARFTRRDLAQAQGWTRALVVPMLLSDDHEPVGAFGVYSATADSGRFTESEWDPKVLTFLAHYAALAIHNAARQEALRQAQERHAVAETFAAVGDIAANLLHHLNNKVGAIPARVQGIQDKCAELVETSPYLAHSLTEIEQSAVEAMSSVRASLSLLNPIHLGPVHVAECVRAAVAASHLPAGVQIQTDRLDHLPAVVAARSSLVMVFTNLFENAADAMHGEGRITIRGAAAHEGVELAVVDNGPGVAPELHDRIFELSYSGRAGTRPGKLGFGLWWVKTLMTRLGGSVAVDSDGHHGATFRLWLPAVQERQ
ncbi:MAG: GAF domain-containing protein [Anaerolineae bacterium]